MHVLARACGARSRAEVFLEGSDVLYPSSYSAHPRKGPSKLWITLTNALLGPFFGGVRGVWLGVLRGPCDLATSYSRA